MMRSQGILLLLYFAICCFHVVLGNEEEEFGIAGALSVSAEQYTGLSEMKGGSVTKYAYRVTHQVEPNLSLT